MSRRPRPAVAHVVMACLVMDSALAAAPVAPAPPDRVVLSMLAPPHAALEDCNAAIDEGRAPVTTVSRTHLWPPNHALVDVGLTVDATADCAGLVSMDVSVWADEAD